MWAILREDGWHLETDHPRGGCSGAGGACAGPFAARPRAPGPRACKGGGRTARRWILDGACVAVSTKRGTEAAVFLAPGRATRRASSRGAGGDPRGSPAGDRAAGDDREGDDPRGMFQWVAGERWEACARVAAGILSGRYDRLGMPRIVGAWDLVEGYPELASPAALAAAGLLTPAQAADSAGWLEAAWARALGGGDEG